ncbi:MAG: hypothetical protein J0I69_06505 [Altererythrobacter sp.]|nr:hypothetical protein [Altererythrobacter sp.]OJU59680.1 MAG: hypothetical protein BGO08_01610 [Altererythrobacter sp. 66-12]
MTSGWHTTRKTIAALLLAGVAMALPGPAAAQDSDARLRRIESQINALQRAVFPGGDGRYFTPEVDTSRPQTPTPAVPTPSSSALTDMLARLDALEAQLAGLTARTEENANQLAQLEAQMKAMRDAQAAAPVAIAPPTGVIPVPSASGAAPAPGRTPAASTPTPAPAAASAPSPARVAAVQAIAKPSTGDAGDDEYTYGFRLWEAGFFPEARQQLSLFLQKYPTHAKASYGRNLLGRAFLDDGKPREAAAAFLENYQKDKNGARAADSLLFLSEAMVGIGDTDRACIALAEFSEAYPALATGRLKEQYDRDRSKVTCQ